MMKSKGRPTVLRGGIGDAICGRVASGESLRKVCRGAGMPARSTVLRWLVAEGEPYATFQGQYARASEARAEGWAEEIVDVADSEKDPQRARVRVDARKWVASKLLPKKYGERLQVDAKLTVEEAILAAAGGLPDDDSGSGAGS